MPSSVPTVVVIGSLNLDYIANVQRLPKPGETLAASALIRRFGGKGANQALAARRQGAAVAMIGCLGKDADGESYRERFTRAGIDMIHVHSVGREPTGTALIAVDAEAENLIIVAPGANGRVTPAMVRKAKGLIGKSGALLAQLEVPVPAVLAAMKAANQAGVPVVFNPSPFRKDFPWGGVSLDFVVVNESEAGQLLRKPVQDVVRTPKKWRTALRRRRIGNLIVTRGARSTWILNSDGLVEVPSYPVTPVDTVGAGDAFAGTLTAHLAGGAHLERAVMLGNAAGALATLKSGAQEAIPTAVATRRLTLP